MSGSRPEGQERELPVGTFGRGGPRYLRLVGRLLRHTLSPGSIGAILRPFGLRRTLVLLLFVPAFLAIQLVHWLGLLLDEILFPGYRKVEIREPVFVVGLPRSGTSYLQRVLAQDESRFTTLRLWEVIVAPSITERRAWLAGAALDRLVGRPGGRVLERLQAIVFRFMDDVHPVKLDEPEEDYFFLLPAFACFLLVVPFPLHPAVWALARFDDLPVPERSRLVAFYRSCVQRHLYVTGEDRRILSKNPSFTPMVRTLSDAFPDARLIFSLRHPREGVPSLLSSLEDGARMFGWDVRTPHLRDRFVDMLVHFAGHGVETLSSLPPERHAFVPLLALSRNVETTVRELYRRFGWSPDPAFVERLKVETERSRAFQSEHLYTLADFGLPEDEIVERFSPHLDRFDLKGSRAP